MKYIVAPNTGTTQGYCFFPFPGSSGGGCGKVCANNCSHVCPVDCMVFGEQKGGK